MIAVWTVSCTKFRNVADATTAELVRNGKVRERRACSLTTSAFKHFLGISGGERPARFRAAIAINSRSFIALERLRTATMINCDEVGTENRSLDLQAWVIGIFISD